MTRLDDHEISRRTIAAPEYAFPDSCPPPAVGTLNITVLSGGPSAEREVSLKSGAAVAKALKSLGHVVNVADIAPDDLSALDIDADMVFIALHGTFGEDGTIQRILEDRNILYCGCDAKASSLAMDKAATKCRWLEDNIPSPSFDIVTPGRINRILKEWTAPVVLKPVDEGSSVDCHIIKDTEQLGPILRDLMQRYDRCLIERFIDGLELTVGVVGDIALPPIEIRTKRSFYDYQAKYVDNDTEYLFDIDLPAPVLDLIQALSLKAFGSLGCRDMSRVDWMVDRETFEPYALEVNTIPGFTDHSLLPKAAAKVGLSFPALCQRIVELTMTRA